MCGVRRTCGFLVVPASSGLLGITGTEKATLEINFTGDELILTLVSLIRATDPRLLRQGPEGLQVDFASFERKSILTEDERLLLRLRGALEAAASDGTHALELSWMEGQRLAQTLDGLEKLQKWEPDVIAMSQGLKSRLMGLTESA